MCAILKGSIFIWADSAIMKPKRGGAQRHLLSRQALETPPAAPAQLQTGSSWIPRAAQSPNRIPALPSAAANPRRSSGSETAAGSDWPTELGAGGWVWCPPRKGGGAGCGPPGGEAATAQAWMETDTQTNKTHHPEASSSSPPTFLGLHLSRLPVARLSPPPPTSGHVPLAARATHGGALNLSPPGAELEAGAARAARTAGGREWRREPGPAAPPGGG